MRSRAVRLPLVCTFSTGGLTDRVQRLLGAPAQVGELVGGGVDVDGGGQQRQLIGFQSYKECAERKNTHTNPETLVCYIVTS